MVLIKKKKGNNRCRLNKAHKQNKIIQIKKDNEAQLVLEHTNLDEIYLLKYRVKIKVNFVRIPLIKAVNLVNSIKAEICRSNYTPLGSTYDHPRF